MPYIDGGVIRDYKVDSDYMNNDASAVTLVDESYAQKGDIAGGVRMDKRHLNTYDGKIFAAVSNTENGEVSDKTMFYYHQDNDIVWAEYSGGDIVKGFLIGKAGRDDSLEFSYQHINANSEIRIGKCNSILERLSNGRLRLHESWQWLNGDMSKGVSVIEECDG